MSSQRRSDPNLFCLLLPVSIWSSFPLWKVKSHLEVSDDCPTFGSLKNIFLTARLSLKTTWRTYTTRKCMFKCHVYPFSRIYELTLGSSSRLILGLDENNEIKLGQQVLPLTWQSLLRCCSLLSKISCFIFLYLIFYVSLSNDCIIFKTDNCQ